MDTRLMSQEQAADGAIDGSSAGNAIIAEEATTEAAAALGEPMPPQASDIVSPVELANYLELLLAQQTKREMIDMGSQSQVSQEESIAASAVVQMAAFGGGGSRLTIFDNKLPVEQQYDEYDEQLDEYDELDEIDDMDAALDGDEQTQVAPRSSERNNVMSLGTRKKQQQQPKVAALELEQILAGDYEVPDIFGAADATAAAAVEQGEEQEDAAPGTRKRGRKPQPQKTAASDRPKRKMFATQYYGDDTENHEEGQAGAAEEQEDAADADYQEESSDEETKPSKKKRRLSGAAAKSKANKEAKNDNEEEDQDSLEMPAKRGRGRPARARGGRGGRGHGRVRGAAETTDEEEEPAPVTTAGRGRSKKVVQALVDSKRTQADRLLSGLQKIKNAAKAKNKKQAPGTAAAAASSSAAAASDNDVDQEDQKEQETEEPAIISMDMSDALTAGERFTGEFSTQTDLVLTSIADVVEAITIVHMDMFIPNSSSKDATGTVDSREVKKLMYGMDINKQLPMGGNQGYWAAIKRGLQKTGLAAPEVNQPQDLSLVQEELQSTRVKAHFEKMKKGKRNYADYFVVNQSSTTINDGTGYHKERALLQGIYLSHPTEEKRKTLQFRQLRATLGSKYYPNCVTDEDFKLQHKEYLKNGEGKLRTEVKEDSNTIYVNDRQKVLLFETQKLMIVGVNLGAPWEDQDFNVYGSQWRHVERGAGASRTAVTNANGASEAATSASEAVAQPNANAADAPQAKSQEQIKLELLAQATAKLLLGESSDFTEDRLPKVTLRLPNENRLYLSVPVTCAPIGISLESMLSQEDREKLRGIISTQLDDAKLLSSSNSSRTEAIYNINLLRPCAMVLRAFRTKTHIFVLLWKKQAMAIKD